MKASPCKQTNRFDQLTHCGLVTLYSDIYLGQHWLRQWLAAWRHQAITWTNVDFPSLKYTDNQMRAILQEIPQPLIPKFILKITKSIFLLPPEAMS